MADNNENRNDPYSQLKGYFPEAYDLSPDELEMEIEIEAKQNSIALNMTEPKADKTPPTRPPMFFGKNSAYGAYKSTQSTKCEDIKLSASTEPTEIGVTQSVNSDMRSYEDESEADQAEAESFDGAYETYEESRDETKPIEITDEPSHDATEYDTIAESEISVPEAQDISENDLLNQYDSLDELLKKMDGDDNDGDGDDDDDEDKSLRSRVNWCFDFLEVFTICMVCILMLFSFVARLTKVDGDSMNDTLLNGQYLIVSDLFYTPKAGDIVVLQNTSLSLELLKSPLVKRVIATGGQTVDVSAMGTVTVTDKDGTSHVIEQEYIKDEAYKKSPYHCYVPEGYVFVMGDNRNNSTDSRDPRVGLIDERCIFGKAIMRILPFSEFTFFSNPYE